jgi:ribosomal-protein-alanine N-acetyltransferase
MNAELQSSLLRSLRFRVMTLSDVPFILDIERDSYPFPWSEGIFRDCVRVGYFCRVVELRGVVSGYGVMSFGTGEAHILNLCIHRELRDQGAGRMLVQHLLNAARNAGMYDVFLEVRPSNNGAIRLYESLGFVRIGVRKGYYQASPGREDAWVYKLSVKSINEVC